MSRRILFVDDEQNILAGFQRMFRKDYQLDTAGSGAEGLERIAESGPYAVVLSDMRMPGMNGADFLARVRDVCPDSVRMVLTGETDIGSAVRAVNEGWIFRFLLKPCPEPALRAALDAALRQHELEATERNLLETTLSGSIKVLTEVLSLVNPVAFGQSVRIQRYVRHMVQKLGIDKDAWQFEVAAMLCQLGCVAIPPATLEAVQCGQPLPDADRDRYTMHASVAHDLLVHVPRLQNVALMICRQHESVGSHDPKDLSALGAQMLKVALAFDAHMWRGSSVESALGALRTRPREYPAQLVDALTDFHSHGVKFRAQVTPISRLVPGMIIDEDVRTAVGLLLVARGQEATGPMLARLRNFHQHGSIRGSVRVLTMGDAEAVSA